MVNNKVCIVMGGTDAVCAWSAKEMAKNGYVTAIVDKNIDAAKRIADEICTFGGLAKAYFLGGDNDISSVRGHITAEFGKCNVIVNSFTKDNINNLLTNTKAFANDMIGESGCSIVNMCADRTHNDGGVEGEVIDLTKNMAVRLADVGIRANAIVYGHILSRGNRDEYYSEDNVPTELCERLMQDIPMKRLCKPEEIVGALRYLTDESSASYTTGNVIYVDGGYSSVR